MKKSYDYIAKRMGLETANRLCVSNPRAALTGAAFPAQPVPVGLWEYEPLRFDLKRIPQDKKSRRGKGSSTSKDTAKKPEETNLKGFWHRLFAPR